MHIVYAVHQQSNKQKIYLYDEERSESFRCLSVCIIPHFVFTRSALWMLMLLLMNGKHEYAQPVCGSGVPRTHTQTASVTALCSAVAASHRLTNPLTVTSIIPSPVIIIARIRSACVHIWASRWHCRTLYRDTATGIVPCMLWERCGRWEILRVALPCNAKHIYNKNTGKPCRMAKRAERNGRVQHRNVPARQRHRYIHMREALARACGKVPRWKRIATNWASMGSCSTAGVAFFPLPVTVFALLFWSGFLFQ